MEFRVRQDDMFVEGGKNMFRVEFLGTTYTVDKNLLKNKKKILEVLATKIYHPDNGKIKTFRQTKYQLTQMIDRYIKYKDLENPDNWTKRSDRRKFTVPAGTYYIGDLCHVLDDDVYENIWGSKFNYKNGLFVTNKDDKEEYFGMHGTADGDGVFYGDNKEFSVDAGHIGIASASLCTKPGFEEFYYTFNHPVTFEYDSDEDTYYITGTNFYVCISSNVDDGEEEDDY